MAAVGGEGNEARAGQGAMKHLVYLSRHTTYKTTTTTSTSTTPRHYYDTGKETTLTTTRCLAARGNPWNPWNQWVTAVTAVEDKVTNTNTSGTRRRRRRSRRWTRTRDLSGRIQGYNSLGVDVHVGMNKGRDTKQHQPQPQPSRRRSRSREKEGEVEGMEDGERERRMIVFSGGTALNCVAKALQQLEGEITHVLPVSDDGGSTAEICRVLGGPAVGDIRSRCLRLSDDTTEEARAVNSLLAHRLSPEDASAAKDEWYEIVEGDHHLWNKISEPYKNTIRAFLVHFQANILRQATLTFDFSNGSIGNYFFAGARIFFRSLEAAIFLYSRVSGIPEGSLVLPAVCTEDRLTLGAELRDGTVIRGQNEISHPSVLQSPGSFRRLEGEGGMSTGLSMCVNKDVDLQNPLDSPISRVLYLSYEGMTFEHEIHLQANPRVMSQLQKCNCVVYGMGSLYTSLCPSLILNGVGETIASLNGVHKVREKTERI